MKTIYCKHSGNKRWLAVALVCLLLISMVCGCSVQNAQGNDVAILPITEPNNSSSQVTLYFGYQGTSNETLLAPLTTQMESQGDAGIEERIVKALIAGPQAEANRPDLIGLINKSTKVLSIQSNNDCLFISLSKEFLEEGPHESMQNAGGGEEEFLRNRYLATYSIVNSVTELGRYSKVQILVDEESNGNAQRIKRGSVGFANQKEELLEPLGRYGALILTPRRSVEQVLGLAKDQSYSGAYSALAALDLDGQQKPTVETFNSMLETSGRTLIDYTILDETVNVLSRSAVVTINARMRTKEGVELQIERVALKMINENEVWKLAYSSFAQIYR